MSRQTVSIREATTENPAGTGLLATATAPVLTHTDVIDVPGWARYATLVLNITAMSGTSEAYDLAAYYIDPIDKTTTVAYPGSGITQITAAGMVIVHIGPVGIADDDTGPIYYLNSPLTGKLSLLSTLYSNQVLEVQTLNLGTAGAADTFKIATAAGGAGKTATITWSATPATLAASIEAAINAVLGTGWVTVAETADPAYTVTFNKSYDAVQLQVTDTATFQEKIDGGYTTGFITTTAYTAGDSSYTYNLSTTYTD